MHKVSYTITIEDGPDADWATRSLTFAEALSEPYKLWLELVSGDITADTDALLGANLELLIEREPLSRTVRGIIAQVQHLGVTNDMLHVRVEVVPALALTMQRVDTRLWQNASVIEVIEEVLAAALGDYEREFDTSRLRGSYPAREYVVQYHESDFAFVSRLLEAEGIRYWFDHEREGGKEVLVLEDVNDDVADVATLDDNPELPVIGDRADQAELESLQALDWSRELTPTAVHRRLFDWHEPTEPLESSAPAGGQADVDERGRRRELYHHGRMIEDAPDPRTIRKLVHHTQKDKVASGHSNVSGLAPGCKFGVAGHQRPDMDREYFVRSVRHRGDCPDAVMADTGDSGSARYENSFVAEPFDAAKPYRPAPLTPRPRIYGPQTAIVTGPEGEEIHTDEHGRVKVRFDWDRVHGLRDDSSMWIRVAHHWAGPGFGTFFVPRIGMEVVVEFIEGNPDRPLIIGCVYNGDNAVSVGLPQNKTQSTIRTRSSPSSEGYNELRFEDAAGSEQIFVHAQRNLSEVVRNAHSTSVGGSQSNTVSGSQTQTIKKDQTETIEGRQTMTVLETRTTEVTKDETNTYHASRSTTVEVDETLTVLGKTTIRSTDTVTLDAQKDLVQTVGGKSSLTVAAGPGGPGDATISCANELEIDAATKVFVGQGGASTITLEGGKAKHATSGSFGVAATGDLLLGSSSGKLAGEAASKVELLNGGATIVIEGGKVSISSLSEITLTVGANSVKIDATGVSIAGALVDVAAVGVASVSGATVKLN